MTERTKIPHKTRIMWAMEYLDLGSEDGLNLAEDMIEGELYFPLIKIIRQCWNALMEDKKNLTLSEQVTAYRASGMGYLKERVDEFGLQVVPPPADPWTEMAVRPNTERRETLRWAGERLRGTLATVAAVLAPKTHDPEVLQQAGEIVAGLLDQGHVKEMTMLRFELEALSVEELSGELQIELGNLLTALAKSLNRGDAEQSSAILQRTRRALLTVGRQVRLKVIEAYGTEPNLNMP